MGIIQLGIVEDDKLIMESLVSYLEENPSIDIVCTATSVEGFMEKLNGPYKPKIDILIMDIGLPGLSGIQGLYPIKQNLPKVDVIMLTTFEEEDKIFAALCAGACSYLSKRTTLAKIEEAIITVKNGGAYMSPVIAKKIAENFRPKPKKLEVDLTSRQQQIIDRIKSGLSYKMIANELGISIDTVRDHIKKIYRLLEVNSKAGLINKIST